MDLDAILNQIEKEINILKKKRTNILKALEIKEKNKQKYAIVSMVNTCRDIINSSEKELDVNEIISLAEDGGFIFTSKSAKGSMNFTLQRLMKKKEINYRREGKKYVYSKKV